MEKQIFELLTKNRQRDELAMLDAYNQKTEMFGLALTKEEAKALIVSRDESLKKYGRVEFGKGILDKLVYSFCDSQYISRENYLAVLTRLQDIFYHFKNESQDKLTDDELLTFMRQQYESVCSWRFGLSGKYMSGTFVKGCQGRVSRIHKERGRR